MFDPLDESDDDGDILGLFPYSHKTETKKRCKIYTNSAQTTGERNKLTKVTTQCQSCANPCCETHRAIVCQDCASTLRKKSPPPDNSDD